MFSKQTKPSDVFWADTGANASSQDSKPDKIAYLLIFLPRLIYTAIIALVLAGIITKIAPALGWICLTYFIGFGSLSFYRWNRKKAKQTIAQNIQERARQITGASTIGSAVHVAGHPLLERDQPMVLALIDDHLSIYKYDSGDPLDTISLADISSIHTVVYDDERVPHIEVIDSAAQALQFSITKQGQPVTFLFRSMLKVRPIDWYHAIEKARFAIRTA